MGKLMKLFDARIVKDENAYRALRLQYDQIIGFVAMEKGDEIRMIDKERLIKAWEIFKKSNPYEICEGREFRAIKEPEYCMGQMISDTIALLKEQEPQPMIEIEDDDLYAWSPEDVNYYCPRPECEKRISYDYNFCPYCGQAVKRRNG